jgi:hypothetical protein
VIVVNSKSQVMPASWIAVMYATLRAAGDHFQHSLSSDSSAMFGPALGSLDSIGNRTLIKDLEMRDTFRAGFAPLEATSCIFIGIAADTAFGGAILSFGALYLRKCQFDGCSSTDYGGSVAAFSLLSVNLSSFTNSESERAAAVFSESYSFESFELQHCAALKCSSRSGDGIIFRRRPAQLRNEFLNMTDCIGSGSFGGFLASDGECTFTEISFLNCRGALYNSGLSVLSSTFFIVSFCSFSNLSRVSGVDYGAVAFHCGTCNYGKLNNCVFLKCTNMDRPSIYLWAGNPIYVIACCFIESREFESQEIGQFLAFEGCSFGTKCRLRNTSHAIWHDGEYNRKIRQWLLSFFVFVAVIGACIDIVRLHEANH